MVPPAQGILRSFDSCCAPRLLFTMLPIRRGSFDYYAKFFRLSEDFLTDAVRVAPVKEAWDDDWDDIAIFRGDQVPDRPVAFRRDEGRTRYDLIGTTLALPKLVSDRFVEVLEQHELTGWRAYPVDVADELGGRMEGLNGLVVTGRSGPPIEKWSDEVMIPPQTSRGQFGTRLKGVYFEPDTWDETDLFLPGSAGFVLGSASAARAIRGAGITNVTIEPLTDVLYPALRGRKGRT
jgi:hypothetical protein